VRPSFWARTRAARAAGASLHRGCPCCGMAVHLLRDGSCAIESICSRCRCAPPLQVSSQHVCTSRPALCAAWRTRDCLSRRLHMPLAAQRGAAGAGSWWRWARARWRAAGAWSRSAVSAAIRTRSRGAWAACPSSARATGWTTGRCCTATAPCCPRSHCRRGPGRARCRPAGAGRAPLEAARAARGRRPSPTLKH